MTDKELENLLVTKLEGKKIDFSNPSDLAEFFAEDFPEYRDIDVTGS